MVESTLRKSILFSSTAFVEGWAHYCEQMMIDAGFRKGDTNASRPARRIPDPSLSLHRRHPLALRGHVGRTGSALLRDEAFLEESTARRPNEARSTRPTCCTAGKLMLLKLREDYKAQLGAKFSRAFHDTLLWDGAHLAARALMLGAQNGGEALE